MVKKDYFSRKKLYYFTYLLMYWYRFGVVKEEEYNMRSYGRTTDW